MPGHLGGELPEIPCLCLPCHPRVLGWQVCPIVPSFTRALEIQIQFLVLASRVSYPLNYRPSHPPPQVLGLKM